jgi:hypothetical protein
MQMGRSLRREAITFSNGKLKTGMTFAPQVLATLMSNQLQAACRNVCATGLPNLSRWCAPLTAPWKQGFASQDMPPVSWQTREVKNPTAFTWLSIRFLLLD